MKTTKLGRVYLPEEDTLQRYGVFYSEDFAPAKPLWGFVNCSASNPNAPGNSMKKAPLSSPDRS